MLRLSVFGGVFLEQDGIAVDWPARGWQRAALLALLAAARQRGVDRRLLAELLWPDSQESAARHSLDELLSKVRRDLSRDALLGTSAISLNEQVVLTDVAQFEDAVKVGQLEAAIETYRGPFADALRTHESDELERRIAATRIRLHNECAAACERLARGAAEQGDAASRVRWWKKRTELDPVAGRPHRELLSALVDQGDAAEALRVGLAYEARARAELGAADPEVITWLQRLRVLVELPIANTTDTGGATRRRAAAERAIPAGHRLGRLIEDGSLEAIYDVVTDGGTAKAELRMLQPRVASNVTADAFDATFSRAMRVTSAHVVRTIAVAADAEALAVVTGRRSSTNLKQLLQKHRMLNVGEALRIATDVAAGLAALHEHHVIHGNLRPRHIGVTGAVTVSGYGVIQLVSPSPNGEDRSTVMSYGAPTYQSPEQFVGSVNADAMSDVYALGTILFEMLAGRPPFGAPGDLDGLQRKLRAAAPPIRELREAVPAAVERLIAGCLEKFAADRPASMRDVENQLRTLLHS